MQRMDWGVRPWSRPRSGRACWTGPRRLRTFGETSSSPGTLWVSSASSCCGSTACRCSFPWSKKQDAARAALRPQVARTRRRRSARCLSSTTRRSMPGQLSAACSSSHACTPTACAASRSLPAVCRRSPHLQAGLLVLPSSVALPAKLELPAPPAALWNPDNSAACYTLEPTQ